MTEAIRAAIIGLGNSTPGKGGGHSFAYCHGWAYDATPGMEPVAACSRSKENVDDFTAEFPGCRGFQDYQQMLADVKPDMVSVCAFAPDREPMVMAALENGAKAVLIEKPFALTLDAARRMMEAGKKSGARLFVNHQRRYGKPFEWFRDAADKIGELQSVEVNQPFGTFLNFGPHLVDAALFALGKDRLTKSVLGAVDMNKAGEWHGTKTESQLLGSIHMSDGTRLIIEAGNDTCGKLPVLRLNGSLGFAELHMEPAPDAGSVFRARYADESAVASPVTDEHLHHGDDPALYMKRAILDIREAINTGKATLIDATEGYRGLEIILGIYESARQGRRLTTPLQ